MDRVLPAAALGAVCPRRRRGYNGTARPWAWSPRVRLQTPSLVDRVDVCSGEPQSQGNGKNMQRGESQIGLRCQTDGNLACVAFLYLFFCLSIFACYIVCLVQELTFRFFILCALKTNANHFSR